MSVAMARSAVDVQGGDADGGDVGVDAAGVGLFLTEGARTGAAPGLGGSAGAAVLGRGGVRDGQPFVLGPDGSYDVALNRFFRELGGWGVRAANSVSAYARDVMLFCRFLDTSRGGKTIWECDGGDLRAYKAVRSLSARNSCWPVVAAIDRSSVVLLSGPAIRAACLRQCRHTPSSAGTCRRPQVRQHPAGRFTA